MIIQAIGLLDDLDNELNTYAMRVREWYGRHFPELTKIVADNIQYAKAVKMMGDRANAVNLDFSEILPEDVEAELKEAAVISMGTEVSDLDLLNIRELCDQVLALSEYKGQFFDYLKSRMNTIAPNLTALVGARLIARGGSLMNLAKQPGSTIQILGYREGMLNTVCFWEFFNCLPFSTCISDTWFLMQKPCGLLRILNCLYNLSTAHAWLFASTILFTCCQSIDHSPGLLDQFHSTRPFCLAS